MADQQSFALLLKRLETATSKLEELALHNEPTKGSASKEANGKASHFIQPFEDIIKGTLQEFLKCGHEIGGVIAEQSELVKKAFECQLKLIEKCANLAKQDQPQLVELFKDTQQILDAIVALKEGNRGAFFNHLATVAEGIPALAWIFAEPKPAPFASDMKDSAQFYANRVLKESKDSNDKKAGEWAGKFIALLGELIDYIKKYHTTGFCWSKNASATQQAPAASTSTTASTPVSGKIAGIANVFGELKKGEGITSGLKKVEKSLMTHKNPELRASSVVKATEDSSKVAVDAKSAVKGPAKCALEGNKWVIENQVNNSSIVLDNVELKQTVYIFNCIGSAIQVKGKVNAITIDNCKKLGLVVESVVSSIDLVNSKSAQVQILGKTPTVSVDKTDGLQLYLSKDCLDVQILSSKSSEMNILIPSSSDGDYSEKAVPEQYKTVVSPNGMLITGPVEHKA